MLDIIFHTVILILSLGGLYSLIRRIYLNLLLPPGGIQQFVLTLRDDSAENDLRAATEASREFGGRFCKRIVAVCRDSECDAFRIASIYSAANKNIVVCFPDDLWEVLTENSEER